MLGGFLSLVLVSQSYVSLKCADDLIAKYQDNKILQCFKDELFEVTGGVYHINDRVICQNRGLLAFHFYEENSGKIWLEIRGQDSGLYPTIESSASLYSYSSCEEAKTKMESFDEVVPSELFLPSRKDFSNNDSILIVSSKSYCERLNPDLSRLIFKYQNENRFNSKVLCIDDKKIKSSTPSDIRAKIKSELDGQRGILIIGDKIPPFEFFYRTGYESSFSAYGYGSTDLPYGDMKSKFWAIPQKKITEGIGDIVYRDKDYAFTTSSPTSYTYDLDRVDLDIEAPEVWVSRWVANPEQIEKYFKQWVDRRLQYSPAQSQNYIHLRGSKGFMFWPQHEDATKLLIKDLSRFTDRLPPESHSAILSSNFISDTIKAIPRSTTFLTLDEHGNSRVVGDLRASQLSSVKWLPEILNINACWTGAWYDANPWYESFISQLFAIDEPPLVTIASLGVKWLPTLGSADAVTEDVFLSDHISGQSLGMGQLRSFRNNLPYIGRLGMDKPFLSQLYHSLSLFGDGSIEY